ncbi:MAG: hypothetical protein MZU91_02925 [Desulfosudis oleivorans]|nr:hypothetical protein [Desulfosudis oleivorans]
MELKELEKQVQEKIKRLETVEAAIKSDLNSYKVVSGDRIKQLVKIYSSMKPNAAATLMNNIDADVAVQVFLGMKGDIAGSILVIYGTCKGCRHNPETRELPGRPVRLRQGIRQLQAVRTLHAVIRTGDTRAASAPCRGLIQRSLERSSKGRSAVEVGVVCAEAPMSWQNIVVESQDHRPSRSTTSIFVRHQGRASCRACRPW